MAIFGTPQDRRKLLHQHEAGTSVDDLADQHNCDRRTVLAALELGEEERSVQQAREAVYRQRLERHFDALGRAAEDLRNSLRLPHPALGKAVWPNHEYERALDAKLLQSLRRHLPGFPVWKLLRDWEVGNRKHGDALTRLCQKTRAAVGKRKWEPDAAQAFTILVQGIAQGHEVPDSLGGYPVLARKARQEVDSFLSKARRWPETKEFAESFDDLRRIREQLLSELDTIMHTVIIPGRCDYCSPHR